MPGVFSPPSLATSFPSHPQMFERSGEERKDEASCRVRTFLLDKLKYVVAFAYMS